MSKQAFGVGILSMGVLLVSLRAPFARGMSQLNSRLGVKSDEALNRRTAVVVGVLGILLGLLTLAGFPVPWVER